MAITNIRVTHICPTGNHGRVTYLRDGIPQIAENVDFNDFILDGYEDRTLGKNSPATLVELRQLVVGAKRGSHRNWTDIKATLEAK